MFALDLIVLIPLLLAAVALPAARVASEAPRLVALLGVGAQLALLLSLGASGVWAGERLTSNALGALGGVWALSTDGLSTPLLALTGLTGLMAVAASWNISKRPGAHFALLLALQSAVAAVFLADNVILFYVAWESVLVPMFLLIAGWGSSDARRAAMKFLIYTFAGGAVLLAGLIYLTMSAGSISFSQIAENSSAVRLPALAFALLAVGFLVKLPVVGLHTWLPDAHTEAPTAGSIVLAGVLLKMGGYGMIRLALPMAPQGFAQAAPILAALGLAGIVLGGAAALVQSDLKRLVAYSSVAHMGFVLLAVSVGTPTALAGALLVMVSHGFVASALFFLVGAVYERAHTREIARFGGLGSVTPRWSVAFVFFALASAGLPGLSGFPGEFVAVAEGFAAWGWPSAVVGVGVVLAAGYNLRAITETVQGPVGSFPELPDAGVRETLVAALTAVVVIALGVAPWVVTGPASIVLTQIARAAGGQ